mgnify:CR=1 FL=1
MIRWGWSENKKEVLTKEKKQTIINQELINNPIQPIGIDTKMMLLNLFFCCNLLFRCFHRELFQEVNDGVA